VVDAELLAINSEVEHFDQVIGSAGWRAGR
jgi:hypothetical protein